MDQNLLKGAFPEVSIEPEVTLDDEFIRFGRPFIGQEEIDAVAETLRSGWIGMGQKTKTFENNFSRYVNSRNSVAVNSCTAGLHLALIASGIKPGDEVITTPLTFASTVTSIIEAGGKPVLADINPETLNIDPERIAEVITPRTKAILPVHFGGLPCDMEKIFELADRFDLKVIEDAAHAIGARYHGKMIGGLDNTIASFSFYPNKNMTTIEGGMVTTGIDEIAEKIRILRLHGLSSDAWKRYNSGHLVQSHLVDLGYKYNFTDVQAAIGIPQLRRVERNLYIREIYARLYDEAFENLDGVTLQYRPERGYQDRHALHLYTITIDEKKFRASRDQIVDALIKRRIGASIHYPPMTAHPYFQESGTFEGSRIPVAERTGRNIFSIPIYPDMGEENVQRVIFTVSETLKEFRR